MVSLTPGEGHSERDLYVGLRCPSHMLHPAADHDRLPQLPRTMQPKDISGARSAFELIKWLFKSALQSLESVKGELTFP